VPFMLVVSPDVPVRDLKSFTEYARSNPGKLSYASFGLGTSNHLFGEYFRARTGTEIVHVPYRGSAPAITDLLTGRVQMAFDTVPVLLPYIASGQLRALGVAMNERSPLAPDVPTLAEAGLPNFVGGTWFALYGPARMPRERVELMNQLFGRVLGSPDMRRTLGERGIVASPSTPEELTQFVDGEVARWSRVVRDAKITIE